MILFSFKMIIVLSICIYLIYRFSYLHTYLKKMLEQYLSWVSYHWLVFFHCLLVIYNCLLFFLFKIINYSVQFSHSVVSDSLQPHVLQHTSPSCTSPTPGVYSNSCPLGRWCHPTISSSVVPFSSRLQSFPASVSFPVSQFFASGGQSTGVSTSASVLPMNIQGWSP